MGNIAVWVVMFLEFLAVVWLGRLLLKLRAQVKDLSTRQGELPNAAEFTSLKANIADFAGRLGTVEADLVSTPAMPKGTINLSKRGQVIRLYRRGDEPADIAAAVGLRRADVDLIIKLQKLSLLPRTSDAAV